MPPFLSKVHNELMFNFIRTGRSSLINNCHISWAKDNNGFIFPINIYLTLAFGNTEDLYIYGTLVKFHTSSE